MKVIFLDIDGVLNNQRSMELGHVERKAPDPRRPWQTMDPDTVARLQKLVDATEAKIVISSSWRGKSLEDSSHVMKALKWAGFTSLNSVIDVTPRLMDGRGDEIKHWLDRHPEVTHFVILDDDSFDILPVFPDKLVKTKNPIGLLDEHVEQALSHLS